MENLLIRAKHLFVAAILAGPPAGGRPRTHEGGEGAEMKLGRPRTALEGPAPPAGRDARRSGGVPGLWPR
jgi:hypothetical protein